MVSTQTLGLAALEEERLTNELREVAESLKSALWFPPSRRLETCLSDPEATWFLQNRLNTIENHWLGCGLGARHRKRVCNTHAGWAQAFKKIASRLSQGCTIALVGPRGTGKTQVAAHAMRYAIERGDQAVYRPFRNVILDVRDTYGSAGRSERSVMSRLTRPRLLVIDELHEGQGTGWEGRTLRHLVDERYRNERDTVLISNETREAFVESVGPSIADRIRETDGILEMNWASFRGPCQELGGVES